LQVFGCAHSQIDAIFTNQKSDIDKKSQKVSADYNKIIILNIASNINLHETTKNDYIVPKPPQNTAENQFMQI
jgi:hypothetical protein